MARPVTWYSDDLGDREPVAAMRDTSARIRAIADGWSPAEFERSYAPGKWTARQILIHLAQSEVALGYRARMALAAPGYAAQTFDQDAVDGARVGRPAAADALDVFLSLGRDEPARSSRRSRQRMRAVALSHPEYGSLTVDWIIHQIAGHQIHHLTAERSTQAARAGSGSCLERNPEPDLTDTLFRTRRIAGVGRRLEQVADRPRRPAKRRPAGVKPLGLMALNRLKTSPIASTWRGRRRWNTFETRRLAASEAAASAVHRVHVPISLTVVLPVAGSNCRPRTPSPGCRRRRRRG